MDDSTFIDIKGNDVSDLGAKIIWDRKSVADIDFKKYRDLEMIDFKKPFQIAYAPQRTSQGVSSYLHKQ